MFIMLVLLSLFPEKKNRYLLPILIPASYLMGYLITIWNERLKYKSVFKTDKIFYGINGWALAAVVFAIPFAAYIFLYQIRIYITYIFDYSDCSNLGHGFFAGLLCI